MFEFLVVLCTFHYHIGERPAISGNAGSKTASRGSKTPTGGKRKSIGHTKSQSSSSSSSEKPRKIQKSGRRGKEEVKVEKEVDRNPRDENFFSGKLCFICNIYILYN